MKSLLLLALAAVLALAGCQAGTYIMRAAAPLEQEGEVYIYTKPFPQESYRLRFTTEEVYALRADGSETPLLPAHTVFAGREMTGQRLFASGRLQPGAYSGLSVKVVKATLTAEEETAELLVPKERVRIDAPFTVQGRKAAVLSLEFNYQASVRESFGFTPVFSSVAPEKPITKLAGVTSNSGSANLTTLDKKSKVAVGVIPTGRQPAGMALDQSLNRLYVALSGDDEVAVIDVATGERLNDIRLAVGDEPKEVGLTPDGRVLLTANYGSNTVSFIDPSAFIEQKRVAVGEGPASLLMDRTGKRAYVLNSRSNTVTALDIPTRTVAGTIAVEAEPVRAQLNRAGDTLYVAHAGSAYMSVVAVPAFSVISRVYLGLGTASIKVDPATDLIYVSKKDDTRLFVYDPFSLIPVDYIEAGGPAAYMAIDGEEDNLLLVMPDEKAVRVVSLNSRKAVSTIDVGEEPYFITLMGERY